MRVYKSIVVLLLLASLLAGCGGGESITQSSETISKTPQTRRDVNVALDTWRNPETVAFTMGKKLNYFQDLGLEIRTFSPVGPAVAIPDVLSGSDEFGVSHEPQVVMAKEKGAPIVVLGSLVQQPTAALIWLKKSHIEDVADLKGKTIAIPGLPFQKSLLGKILAQGGLTLNDVKVESAGNNLVPELTSGGADATFGGSGNIEGVELEARGLDPVVTPVQDFGIPDYNELVVITRADLVSKEPQLVRDFMSAVVRASAAAIEDPKAALNSIEEGAERNPETSRKEMEAQTEATIPLLSEDGQVSPGQARDLIDWMREEGMIQRKVPVATLLTNAYLPAG